ncbi:30S ribosomal protein S20 [Candidatus Parcubacteria bacterium]|nr:MAG: 30S ribosomal protein S20 [Candidatus Parcubacteria bacterium]
MPITESAKKALRQNLRRRTKNLSQKNVYKKAVKDIRRLIAQKKLDEAKALVSKTYKVLDKAAKAGVIKKNKASRLKSQIARGLH